MRIAVCDDDKEELCRMLEVLSNYREQRQVKLHYEGFESAVELLAAMEYQEYDLLLLDILMPGLNGIQTAHEIRDQNEVVKIVFLTSTPEFAVESYTVQAQNYLLKPVTPERLFPVLDQMFNELRSPEASLTIKAPGCVFRLPYDKLESVEVIAKVLYFHMADGTLRKVRATLSEYEPMILAQAGFYKVHRSYLVNFRWVAEMQQSELLTAAGRRIPIARSVCQKVRKDYMEYLFHFGLEENGGSVF